MKGDVSNNGCACKLEPASVGISIAWQGHKAIQVEAFDCREARGGALAKGRHVWWGMKEDKH